MSPPAVGICAAVERARWTVWEETVTMAPRSYADAVQRAGGIALLLPPDPTADDRAEAFLNRIDALILSGGADVDPGGYGAERDPSTGATWPDRDEFEAALARGAIEREMPVLGICRGMQMLNVALGGTLHQHVPDVVGHSGHLHTPGAFRDHEVRLEPGSLAARAAGADRIVVKSHHHQAVATLGEGLVATGWSQPDDLIEAVEVPGGRFVLGVLWHPEEDDRSTIFPALVEAARNGVAV
jgi:putative glutamine amidotransferase